MSYKVGPLENPACIGETEVPYTEAVSLHIGSSVTIKGKPVQPFMMEPPCRYRSWRPSSTRQKTCSGCTVGQSRGLGEEDSQGLRLQLFTYKGPQNFHAVDTHQLRQKELKQPHREEACIISRKASDCTGAKWEGFVGTLCGNEPQLQVDFHTAMDEVSDIAFHFQVYFGRYVAMNSRENGAWKQEVKSKNMPFEDGKEFELRISVLENVYQVMVNGQFSYTFDHRLPQGSVKMVQVWRDISLTSMSVQN
ncbi:hypothetical protein P7K49_034349 [Saguinus oedipus]|uniref:Galectin n=1 Tax=Saguinus oedipus TaxID=9490 RepID=A0ABQ9TUH3_SAGOE|nr:hypothetical protein P7K49_034349 [Saguinus oedipus]